MKNISFLLLVCFCLCSCEKEQTDTEIQIIGKTFGNSCLSLTFEDNDSVSFRTKYTSYLCAGKSKYEIDNGVITIKNPYGRRLKPEETTESYILDFKGFLKKDRIDNVLVFIIGPYEKEQVLGKHITLFLE